MIIDTIIIATIALSPVDTVKKESVKVDMQKLPEASDRVARKAYDLTKEEFYKLLNSSNVVRKRTTK